MTLGFFCGLLGLFFILLGLLVKAFPNLIAGYNTMPKGKKALVDINGLSSLMRNGLVFIGLMLIVGCFLILYTRFEAIAEFYIFTVIIMGLIIILVKAQKFQPRKM